MDRDNSCRFEQLWNHSFQWIELCQIFIMGCTCKSMACIGICSPLPPRTSDIVDQMQLHSTLLASFIHKWFTLNVNKVTKCGFRGVCVRYEQILVPQLKPKLRIHNGSASIILLGGKQLSCSINILVVASTVNNSIT